MRLSQEYFQNTDTVWLAKDLLGKVICSHINGVLTSGIILETEAYLGVEDKASHAYANRYTSRTKTMYEAGGVAYVYLCYGIHHLFNIVNHQAGVPHAILIRSIQAMDGLESILKRRKVRKANKNYLNGPGKVAQALGIDISHNGISLSGPELWLEDRGLKINKSAIISGARVGIDYAEEDALLPYRFIYRGSIQ